MKTVTLTNMRFHWMDIGDMHPGTTTEMDSGQEVDNAEFTGAGASFPINIPFAAQGSSLWSVSAPWLGLVVGIAERLSPSTSLSFDSTPAAATFKEVSSSRM